MKKLVSPDIIQQLKASILALEGFKPNKNTSENQAGLAILGAHFPNAAFPLTALHEFLVSSKGELASTYAFISVLLSQLYPQGTFIWLGRQQQLFNIGLCDFGVQSQQIIFINLCKTQDIFWAVEEILKSKCVDAVLCELPELNFRQSQRLQRYIEKYGTAAFVICPERELAKHNACTARWQVRPAKSINQDGLPGIGYTCWEIELLKVRNGNTGKHLLTWRNQQLERPSAPPNKTIKQEAKGA